MDPDRFSAPTNNPNQISSAPAPAGKPFSKKMVIIGAVVLLLVITIVVVVMNFGKKAPDATGKDASLYISREGYQEENDSIGDATALFASASNKVIPFGGLNVVQPCALLTLDDLKASNIFLSANSLTGPVVRNVYDGRGSQQVEKISDYLLPSSGDANECAYWLKDEKTIDISVLQAYNVSAKALSDEIAKKYAPIADMSGLKAYKNTRENSINKTESTYLLRSSNATVIVRVDIPDQAVKERVVAKVAERLKKAESTPTPLTSFSYKSPVMNASVFAHCDILSDSAFKQVVGVDASALTEEKFASSIGVVNDPVTQKGQNYTSYDCKREGFDDKGSLTMQAVTYETAEAAKNIFAFETSPAALASNIQPVTPTIGDESAFGDFAALHNSLVVRKGRLILRISYQNATTSKIDAQVRISTLRPVLESAVKTLTDF